MVAGIAFKGNVFGAAEAQTTLDTNFLGTKAVCEALAPLMGKGGRIVNVCSSAGKQRIIKNPALLQRFKVRLRCFGIGTSILHLLVVGRVHVRSTARFTQLKTFESKNSSSNAANHTYLLVWILAPSHGRLWRRVIIPAAALVPVT